MFPALDAATEAALRESIRRFGVLVPVVRDQHGRTLDGHHRSRIADELGVKFRVDVVRVESDEQAREIAATLNTDRRQLDAGQRREIVAALRAQGHSLRAIAGAVGVSKSQVADDVAQVSTTGHLPPEVIGKDGKKYPARKPTIVAATNEREAEKAQEVLTAVDSGPEGVTTVRNIARVAHGERKEAERQAERDTPPPVEIDARLCACADLQINEPVDAIITDPPYPREYLHTFTDLAELASRSLKPGGSLVVMSGQSYLPEVIHRLESSGLTYQWTLAYLTPGGQATQLWARKVNTFWKPLLWFTNGEYDGDWIGDVARSDVNDNDKNHHHWGQSESGMADVIRRFTSPGDLIVDPFLGGGTTGIVALQLGRRFIGADVEQEAIDATRRRLAA